MIFLLLFEKKIFKNINYKMEINQKQYQKLRCYAKISSKHIYKVNALLIS